VSQRRRRREEIIRRNRLEIVRRAQEEGIAVDLDELAAVGNDLDEEGRWRTQYADRSDRTRSFDDIVGSDGMLKARSVVDEGPASISGAAAGPPEGVRQRTKGERGMAQGASFANPFIEEDMGGLTLDQTQTEPSAPSVSESAPSLIDTSEPDEPISEGVATPRQTSRERSATLVAEDPPFSLPVSTLEHEMSLLLEREAVDSAQWAEQSNSGLPQDQTSSFHSAASDRSNTSDPFSSLHELDTDAGSQSPSTLSMSPIIPAGMDVTPPTEDQGTQDGFTTAGSVVGSERDVDMLSDTGSSDTEDFSEAAGIRTPSEASWTDVESLSGSEYGYHQGPGNGNGGASA